jgi:predicted dehydrogenase
MKPLSRRTFLHTVGAGVAAFQLAGSKAAANDASEKAKESPIAGLAPVETDKESWKVWKPVSDRKLRVGIAGHGVCQFGAAFYFQNHPNVIVAAVTDLFPDRCAALAKLCKCEKTYPSCEEMIKDKSLDAVYIATDPPSHARLAIAALKAGKHVASAVPATWGSLEEAQALFETVKSTGLKYMMFETSYFQQDLYAMRQLYQAGELGKVIYCEGEYWHYGGTPIDSYKGWRIGGIPQWYGTHSNAYYIGMTGGSFTEVSCMGLPSILDQFQPGNNKYKNPFATEIALFRARHGGMVRMGVSWDTPGLEPAVKGRVRGTKGAYDARFESVAGGPNTVQPVIKRPPLPPGVEAGGHDGSHGNLMSDFVEAILADRKPLVDVAQALNMTVGGIVAHQSAMKGGELLKITQFSL